MIPVDGDSSAATQRSSGSRRCAAPDRGDAGDLLLARRKDELAEPRVRHAVALAIIIKRVAPGNAARRLEAAGGIVEAAVDDLAVARGGLGADHFGALQHDHLAP